MTLTTQIKLRFKSAIRRGTGEAHLLMRQYPKIDVTNYIIEATLTNFAYDGQCESSRAKYLYELISLSGNKAKIREAILKALATEENDTWTLTQLFDLAKIFAKDGDNDARNAIYNRFLTNPINGSDWAGYPEILELDGLEGLKFIADKMGKALEKNPDDRQDDAIIKYFQKENPKIKVVKELVNAGASNRFIKIYLENVKRTEENRKSVIKEKISYKNILDEVLASRIHYRRSKRPLADDELKLIANQLLIEKNTGNREKLLSVFGKEKFPFDSQFILNLAYDKRRSKTRELAIDSLSFLNGENIRKFALESAGKSKNPGKFIGVLKSNYKQGDDKILTDLVKKFRSQDVIESLAISYIDIYKSNATAECKDPLEAIYGKLTCAIHRNVIVKILIENNVISDKLKSEIKFDCDDETRQLL